MLNKTLELQNEYFVNTIFLIYYNFIWSCCYDEPSEL